MVDHAMVNNGVFGVFLLGDFLLFNAPQRFVIANDGYTMLGNGSISPGRPNFPLNIMNSHVKNKKRNYTLPNKTSHISILSSVT